MHDLQPVMALLAQAEKERDEAQAHARRMGDALDAARTQAEQLVVYRREYEQRWGQRFASQGQIELVQCYQGFIVRLNQAVEHQARVQEQAARLLEHARRALQEQELRVASVRKLIERRVGERQLREGRREQKQTDEFAARVAWQRLSNFGSLSAR